MSTNILYIYLIDKLLFRYINVDMLEMLIDVFRRGRFINETPINNDIIRVRHPINVYSYNVFHDLGI